MQTKYVDAAHQNMAYGYTTGSCAAAAAKACMYCLLTGKKVSEITIDTPKGWELRLPVLWEEQIDRDVLDDQFFQTEDFVTCAVRKNAGDDPDVTDGILVYASVAADCKETRYDKVEVTIEGGKGVGRVTLPGLNQPVGAAAINTTPRSMIKYEIEKVCEELEYTGEVQVLISIPEGVEIASKTFNGRLGIVGGISVLGTSGIVEPMSKQALLDTIMVELKVQKERGIRDLVIAPGNMGLDFMKSRYHYDLDKAVKCSNFVGETLDMAVSLGFESIVFVGNIGKAVKLAGGIMNTHSREADCRVEILASCALLAGADREEAENILNSVTTEDVLAKMRQKAWFDKLLSILLQRMEFYLQKRAGEQIKIGVLTFSSVLGELGANAYAKEVFAKSMTAADKINEKE